VGYEVVPHRAAAATGFLLSLAARLRSRKDLQGVADALMSRAKVMRADIQDAKVASEAFKQAKTVYMYDLLFSDNLTRVILDAVAAQGIPGHTRVVMHKDLRTKSPESLAKFKVVYATHTLTARVTSSRVKGWRDKDSLASSLKKRTTAWQDIDADVLHGSLVVLQLKEPLDSA